VPGTRRRLAITFHRFRALTELLVCLPEQALAKRVVARVLFEIRRGRDGSDYQDRGGRR
jgi:hypothetical protein